MKNKLLFYNKICHNNATIAKIVNALQVEPFELFLPPNMGVNYDTRRTKQLMAQLRSTFASLADMLEGFLTEKR